MSTAEVITSGAYVPRTGDWVTIRRYIRQGPAGALTLKSEYAGRISSLEPQADGWRIWLDTLPDSEWIFTGYQFLGQAADGSGPASLVTEVTPMTHDGQRIALTPDFALLLDASQCIVAEVTDPAAGGEVLRRITITDVDAFKAALDTLRAAQQVKLAEAVERRRQGPDERRRAEGRLTRGEAVDYLMAELRMPRGIAVGVTGRALRSALHEPQSLGPVPVRAHGDDERRFLVSYADGYWSVHPVPQG